MSRARWILLGVAGLAAAGALMSVPVLMFLVMSGSSSNTAGECAGTGSIDLQAAGMKGLDREQLANASAIIADGYQRGVPRKAILIALAVAHQESGFVNYANDGRGGDLLFFETGIRRSLQLPHEGVASDHASLGVFQQQWPWWGRMRQLMDPTTAAAKFYSALLHVPGWDSMPVTAAGQAVQRSAYPNAYADDVPLARALLAQASPETTNAAASTAGGTTPTGCVPAVAAGRVTMPLPPWSGYVDEHNFGDTGARWASGHTGTDFSVACGTPVLAATAGTVIIRSDQPWAGHWLVEVSTGVGRLTTWYAHMRAVTVNNGQHVAAGQEIGQVGDLGNATGCHLHFGVHPHGGSIYQDDVNPSVWLHQHLSHGPARFVPTDARSGAFTLATFNTLGASHTTAHGKEPDKASGSARTQGLIRLLDQYDVDLVGLQEFQRPQYDTFTRLAGSTYAVWHPAGDTENSIAWRRSRFQLVAGDSVAIPYFDGHTRQMPVAELHDLATGQNLIIVNVHNPADTRRFPSQARYRTNAVSREVELVRRLTDRYQLPVLLTGDLNDRHDAFCRLTAGSLMAAAAGGGNTGNCQPPAQAGIDWILGNKGVTFGDYTSVKSSLVRRTSDHPLDITRTALGAVG